MSAQAQKQQPTEQVQQPSQQQGAQQGATDMSAFSAGTASGYQGSLGNQGVQAAAGMEGQEASGASGLDLVAELDASLALRLENQLDLATDTASEAGPLLVDTGAERDLDDLYDVRDYIWQELDGLQKLTDGASDEAIREALDRLDTYAKNLSSCVLIVDGERSVSEFYEELLLGEGLGLFCAATQEVAGLKSPANEALSGTQAVEQELAKVVEAMEMLQDVALKAQLDACVDKMTAGISELVGPLEGLAKAAMMMAKKGASFAKDSLYESLRNGSSEGDSLLDEAQGAADLLNEAAEVKIPDQTGMLEIVSEASNVVKYIEGMDEAQELASDGLSGVEREWKKLLKGAAPAALDQGDLAARYASVLSELSADRDHAEEAASTFREQADTIRNQFPDRAERL